MTVAIRDIMHSIRELPVPDRATVAVELMGHLSTVLTRSQLTKLMADVREETERVQAEPPARERAVADRPDARVTVGARATAGVGQAGRGEFRSRELL
ncbi:MAG TPA: hypothetical protein VMN60_05850 [Longimicrobiales bacterium]|nr:hypothetical protein [Longimicrobiales bacterium]